MRPQTRPAAGHQAEIPEELSPSGGRAFDRRHFAGLIGACLVLFIAAGATGSYADDHHLQWLNVVGASLVLVAALGAIFGVIGVIAPRAINKICGRSKLSETSRGSENLEHDPKADEQAALERERESILREASHPALATLGEDLILLSADPID